MSPGCELDLSKLWTGKDRNFMDSRTSLASAVCREVSDDDRRPEPSVLSIGLFALDTAATAAASTSLHDACFDRVAPTQPNVSSNFR